MNRLKSFLRPHRSLTPDGGISFTLVIVLSVVAAFMAANIYYNQPLLDVIRQEMHTSEVAANFVTVVAQVGYALALFFVIPLGDKVSRRLLVALCMMVVLAMSVLMASATGITTLWVASFFIGICSVVPQLFIPVAGQYSTPATKGRNMGYVLTGLLTGILASRVLGGIVGEHFGWRMMYHVNVVIMLVCLIAMLHFMPNMAPNFKGSYRQLMGTVVEIFLCHPKIRLNALHAGLAFGSLMSVWSCMAFHISGAPFHASSETVGMLGMCGVAGALASMNIGKYLSRFGLAKFSVAGAILQIMAWLCMGFFGNSYAGLIVGIILLDIGLQCQQLSNQSACMAELPEASSRVNTIFMTIYFIFGAMGTMLSGLAWNWMGWTGVSAIGLAFAITSLIITYLILPRRSC